MNKLIVAGQDARLSRLARPSGDMRDSGRFPIGYYVT